MAVCTHCGRASQGYERFCMSCGQPLDSGTSSSSSVAAAVSAGTPVFQRTELSSEVPQSDVQPGPAAANGVHADGAVSTSPRSRLIVHRLATADGGSEDGPSIEVGEFILDGRDIAIGRAPSCDIVLEGDQLASRRHALFRSRSDGYTVVDLGSSNGTYINDLEIREAVVLHEGDHISIGGHELVYSTSPAGPHASLAGVKLTEPEPPAPMVDTDPHALAVSARDTAVSQAVSGAYASAPDAYSPDADQDVSTGLAGSDQDMSQEDSVPPEDRGEALAMNDDDVVDGYHADDEAAEEEDEREAPPVSQSVSSQVLPPPTVPAVLESDFANSSITDADYEALRAQLAEVSEALARKASTETRVIKQLRGALASARDQLAALVAGASSAQPLDASSIPNLADLVMIARQAAENPRHLDYLTALAEHADEIANALESNSAASTSNGGVQAPELEALQAKLDEALG
jgi:pSer/pThr/pTyr-binding forkhead associated (FHA) protein